MVDTIENPWSGRKRAPREGQSSEKREAVLLQAAKMFAERGFELASLNDLANSLNVTKPTLYYYFKSKDEILEGVYRRVQDRFEELIAEGEALDGDGRAKLDHIFRAYLDLAISSYGRCWVNVRDRISDATRARLIGAYLASETKIIRVVEIGIADGSLRQQPPMMAYQAAFALLNSMALWYQTDSTPREEFTEELMRQIWGALADRP